MSLIYIIIQRIIQTIFFPLGLFTWPLVDFILAFAQLNLHSGHLGLNIILIMVLQFIFTSIIRVFLGALIFWRKKHEINFPRFLKSIIVINVISVFCYIFVSFICTLISNPDNFYFLLIFTELIRIVIEASFVLAVNKNQIPWKWCFVYSLIANIVSNFLVLPIMTSIVKAML